jgi:hypothetical protein
MQEVTYGGRTIGQALIDEGVECLFGITSICKKNSGKECPTID